MPQATITNTPRNQILGLLADAIQPFKKVANNVNIPILGPLGDFMLEGTQSLLDDASYDGARALGKGGSLQTFNLDPRVLDAASIAYPALKASPNLAKTAGRELARQVQTGTGLVGRNVIDPRLMVVKDPEMQQRAIDYYGTTSRPSETGYILDNGQRLDFTGRRDVPSDYRKVGTSYIPKGQDYLKNERSTDHRDVFNVQENVPYGWDALANFIDQTGAVRYLQDVGVSLVDTNKPSKKQIETIVNDFRMNGEPLTIDVDSKKTGSSIASKDFERPSVSQVQKWLDEVYGGLLD